MRASIASLAAAGLLGVCVSGHAAERHDAFDSSRAVHQDAAKSRPRLDLDDEAVLKATGGSHKSGRMAAEEEKPLKSAGSSHKAGRAADDEVVLKRAGTSGRPDDKPLKSAGASSRPSRTPVTSTGRADRPGRSADELRTIKSAGAARRPVRPAEGGGAQ